MKIIVLTSCVKTKKYRIDNNGLKKLLQDSGYKTPSDDLENEEKYRKVLRQYICSAKEMYQGSFKRISNLAKKLGERAKVHLYIISARYGIISENQTIIPYNATFQEKSKKEIRSRAKQLKIYEKLIEEILKPNHYNQVIVVLGLKYLLTIFDKTEKYDFTKYLKNAKLTIFTSEKMRKKIQYSNLEFIPVRGLGDRNKKIKECTENFNKKEF